MTHALRTAVSKKLSAVVVAAGQSARLRHRAPLADTFRTDGSAWRTTREWRWGALFDRTPLFDQIPFQTIGVYIPMARARRVSVGVDTPHRSADHPSRIGPSSSNPPRLHQTRSQTSAQVQAQAQAGGQVPSVHTRRADTAICCTRCGRSRHVSHCSLPQNHRATAERINPSSPPPPGSRCTCTDANLNRDVSVRHARRRSIRRAYGRARMRAPRARYMYVLRRVVCGMPPRTSSSTHGSQVGRRRRTYSSSV